MPDRDQHIKHPAQAFHLARLDTQKAQPSPFEMRQAGEGQGRFRYRGRHALGNRVLGQATGLPHHPQPVPGQQCPEPVPPSSRSQLCTLGVMTPPDWFLQLLGGAAILVLIVLLVLVGRGLRMAQKNQHPAEPPPAPRTDEAQARWQTHVQRVMRPGTLQVAFDRESVSMGDDTQDHWRLLIFEQDMPLSALLERRIHSVLASIHGDRATWLFQVHQPLEAPIHHGQSVPAWADRVRVTDVAVVAQQWMRPHLFGPDFPVSQIGRGLLYARYLAQRDPDEVVAAYSAEPRVREAVGDRSARFSPRSVPPERRVMV